MQGHDYLRRCPVFLDLALPALCTLIRLSYSVRVIDKPTELLKHVTIFFKKVQLLSCPKHWKKGRQDCDAVTDRLEHLALAVDLDEA